MTIEQVQDILISGGFPGLKQAAHLVETHISWLILTPDFAFKIKKPVHLDFLDFSSLEKRRFYCTEELRLNRRLAPGMYIAVLPIGSEAGRPVIGSSSPPIIDFAVQMHRMDEKCQMDLMLRENKVTEAHLSALARQLVDFHLQMLINEPDTYESGDYQKDFEALYLEENTALKCLGSEVSACFKDWQERIPAFLNRHAIRMRARFEQGFWVDGHGDLHTRNIFLMDTPVVFDCIEFDPHYRRLDVLNELAFLCMDLEARGHSELAEYFIHAYRMLWDVQPTPEDELLFLFFKVYRANIRLKVSLIELRQHESPEALESVGRYWKLLKTHCALL